MHYHHPIYNPGISRACAGPPRLPRELAIPCSEPVLTGGLLLQATMEVEVSFALIQRLVNSNCRPQGAELFLVNCCLSCPLTLLCQHLQSPARPALMKLQKTMPAKLCYACASGLIRPRLVLCRASQISTEYQL